MRPWAAALSRRLLRTDGIPGAASPVLMGLCRAGQPILRRTAPSSMTQAWVVANCMTALRTAVTLWDLLISSPFSLAFFPSAFFAVFSYRFASSCPDLYSWNVFSNYRCSLDRCQLYRDSKW